MTTKEEEKMITRLSDLGRGAVRIATRYNPDHSFTRTKEIRSDPSPPSHTHGNPRSRGDLVGAKGGKGTPSNSNNSNIVKPPSRPPFYLRGPGVSTITSTSDASLPPCREVSTAGILKKKNERAAAQLEKGVYVCVNVRVRVKSVCWDERWQSWIWGDGNDDGDGVYGIDADSSHIIFTDNQYRRSLQNNPIFCLFFFFLYVHRHLHSCFIDINIDNTDQQALFCVFFLSWVRERGREGGSFNPERSLHASGPRPHTRAPPPPPDL